MSNTVNDKPKTILFIIADEKSNAGERDYMKAISIVINRAKDPNLQYLVYKTGPANGKEDAAFSNVLPENDRAYESMPRFDENLLSTITGDVRIVAVGSSTLNDTITAKDYLHFKSGVTVTSVAYITHMVHPDNEEILSNENIIVYAPLSGPSDYDLRSLDAVPHTNSLSSCLADYDLFQQDSRHDEIKGLLDSDAPFAFVVLNAGFEVANEKGENQWHPYEEDEAFDQGYALGRHLPGDTNLFLVDGGPRNLKDEGEFGQKCMDEFRNGYTLAQWEYYDADPRVLCDRFQFGVPYNMIKVGYMLAKRPSCLAFISNSEGYGTMDAAALHVDNKAKLMGMFPFKAQYADSTGQRVANIEKYNRAGIAILTVGDAHQMIIHRHWAELRTPLQQKDAAVEIVRSLELAAPAILQHNTNPRFEP